MNRTKEFSNQKQNTEKTDRFAIRPSRKRREIETDNLLHGLDECVHFSKSHKLCTLVIRTRWNTHTGFFGTNK